MDKLIIRKAERTDMPAVLRLIKELAHYEKCEDQVRMTEDRLVSDGFGISPAFHCLLACREEEVLGFCLSWYRYSTWRGRLLYVEDLYIREAFRRQGIGRKLLEAVMEQAREEGISHVHLQVLDWNEPAIRFYRKYNPEFDQGWINVLIPLEKAVS
jgi:ribosomal protein S18 acetylase RimI-like enzyme